MDTDLCLYCEKRLANITTEVASSNSFCSRRCHANEAAKTQIPAWATPPGSASIRIQKAKAAQPMSMFGYQYYCSTSRSSSTTMTTTTSGSTTMAAIATTANEPSPPFFSTHTRSFSSPGRDHHRYAYSIQSWCNKSASMDAESSSIEEPRGANTTADLECSTPSTFEAEPDIPVASLYA
ncbi:hypothetical protein EC973_000351 [Apophysomyces ossiformis]|uniref:Uncharacterized protein n=1 Tax=Apophysomyces ossiformis TaxID=679940 RepID=A0A8H7EQ29_9FUNG|nr:hypothetical protein EC973_000351 [Apophysomyces ossiformis]